jgi:hypothetical protein
VTNWGAVSNEILTLQQHLIAEKVACVSQRATTGSPSTTCLKTR